MSIVGRCLSGAGLQVVRSVITLRRIGHVEALTCRVGSGLAGGGRYHILRLLNDAYGLFVFRTCAGWE
jgi:hypothetical protein